MLVRAADVRASRVKADYAGDRVKQTIDVADDSQAGELFADDVNLLLTLTMLQSNIIDEGLTDPEGLLTDWLRPNLNDTIDSNLANSTYRNTTASSLYSDGINNPGFQHAFVYIPIQIVISFAAMIANLLTLLALAKVRAKFQPHLILVVNLTISDMLFGLRNVIIRGMVLGFEFNHKLNDWFKEICVRGLIRVAGSAIYTCTYINLLTIALDLYFAIMMPFRYQKLVTRRRTVAVCVSLWLLSVVLAAANYWVSLGDWSVHHRNQTFCDIREKHLKWDVYTHLAIVYLGIVAMTSIYIRIFIEVRRCARSTPGLPIKTQQTVKHNKRKLATSLLVLLTFLVAWLPNGIFTTLYFIMPKFGGPTISLMGSYFATLPMLNSLCDPIIYAIRLDKVRLGFRRLCRCAERPWSRDGYASESTEMVNLSVNSGPEHRSNSREFSHKMLLSGRTELANGNYRREMADNI
ncbi:hypothetical protein LSH36_763g02005 [Paralvinella palmiformis]|uniref:G-protein coupled receptors family 1 profile domain-containing protein n=1 Tax=Paralvinella palmiformis TaxID=53620 RepID=A0AAD9J156_9ANNE|nr:hypothetical protein LSH36_763g02005 [Paralvinella palmiformis]